MSKETDKEAEEAKKRAIEKMNAARNETPQLPDEEGGVKNTQYVSNPDPDGKIQTVHKDEVDKPLDTTELSNIKVYSPFHVYYDGPGYSLSAVNGTGPFDVLPGHKNFLSLLQACTLVVRSKRGQEEMKIDRGVLHVKDNEVIVFLDV